MKIKLFFCAAGLLLMSNHVKAQSSITIDASQNITNFKFVNSTGEQDKKYNANYSGGYSLGYKYAMDNGLFFPVKIGMRKAGATYVYDNTNYSWELQYTEARLGLGYNYKFDKLGAHISATGYFGYMLKANQSLNNEDFDIRSSGIINTSDYGVFISPGANFQANDFINVYLDLNYMLGLANLETDETQKSNNTLYGASLGVAFLIK